MNAAVSPPIVSIRRLSKQFSNGTLALRDVDLDLRQGEFLSLLGPSGCGKSTLLRMLAGLGEASAGQILWPQSTNTGVWGHGFELGFVFQEPTLMPWATALANVTMPLLLKGLQKETATQQASDMLANVGLSAFESAYPRELSGGMKMRVSIARALVTRPRVLLMDEPFAALDEITRQKLNDDLLRLWQHERFTAVFVTHSVYESVYLSERIVVMAARPGRILSDLTIDAPYPRDDLYRTSPEYGRMCRVASDALKKAIAS